MAEPRDLGAPTAPEDGKKERPADTQISKRDGFRYWEGVGADLSGMVGGFPSVSATDLKGSRAFLAKLSISRQSGSKLGRVLEGGAGCVPFDSLVPSPIMYLRVWEGG
jgi:protein N-terminal methyltransferase